MYVCVCVCVGALLMASAPIGNEAETVTGYRMLVAGRVVVGGFVCVCVWVYGCMGVWAYVCMGV